VTLDSSNAVINNGTIHVTSDTNAVGVLFEAGNTGSYSGAGTINALVRDSSNIATGSGNVAFWVSSTGMFIGNITLSANSLIETGGTNSVGVLIDAPLQGTIEMGGAITAEGTGSVGFESNATITGDLTLDSGGSIAASGQDARGVVIAGAIDGAFSSFNAITSTGAQSNVDYTSLPTSQAQFALGIGASISGGFSNSGAIAGTVAQQGVFISPALANVPADITLGEIDASATPYGMVNAGSISVTNSIAGQITSGLLVQGATIGVDTYGVLIQGGIENSGTVTASGSADGTVNGIDIGNHATVPAILNSGTISASASATDAASANGVLIEAGANITTLTNSGSINASASSSAGDAAATAILDQSGTLTTVTNSGYISASASGTTTSSAVAMDLRQALGAVNLTNSGHITGDVLLADHDNTLALVADGDSDATTTSSWTGAIAFGAGSDTFTISGAGVFSGSTTTAGTLAIQVNDGVMALGAIVGGAIRPQVSPRFIEAAQDRYGFRSRRASDGRRETPAVDGARPVENVREREPVKASGWLALEEGRRIREDEPNPIRRSGHGHGPGLARKQLTRVRVASVRMPGEPSLDAASQNSAESRRKRAKERARVNRLQDCGREKGIHRRAESPGVEMPAPVRNLIPRIPEGEKRRPSAIMRSAAPRETGSPRNRRLA